MHNNLGTKNIIKSNEPKSNENKQSSVIKNQILLARREAQAIIKEAVEYAENLRLVTQNESKEKLKEAFEKGTEDALFEFQQNLLEAKEIRERIFRETEKDILKLSVRLAEKIIGKELDKDNKTVIDIVSTALQNARQKERITIRVNPAELPVIQKEAKLFKSSAQTKFIDFMADPRVEKGGCLIESEVGTVDARLETQFRVLERALLAQADGEFVADSK